MSNYGVQGMRPDGRINFDLTERFAINHFIARVPLFKLSNTGANFLEDSQGAKVMTSSNGNAYSIEGVTKGINDLAYACEMISFVYNPGWQVSDPFSPANIGQFIIPEHFVVTSGRERGHLENDGHDYVYDELMVGRVQWSYSFNSFKQNRDLILGGFDIYVGTR